MLVADQEIRLIEDQIYSVLYRDGRVLKEACYDETIWCRHRGAIAIFYTAEGEQKIAIADIIDIADGQ